MTGPPSPSLDQSLRASLATLVDIVADGVIVADREGVVRFCNEGAARVFGLPATAMVGMPVERLLPQRVADVHRRHRAAFASGSASTRWMNERSPVTGRRADGSEFPAEVTIAKWQGPDGPLFGAVVRDLTERERLHRRERLLAQAGERLAETLDVSQTMTSVVEAVVPTLGEWAIVDLRDPVGHPLLLRRRCSHHEESRIEGALRGLERQALDIDAPSAAVDVIRTGAAMLVDPVDDDWLERHAGSPEELTLLRQLRPHALLVTPIHGNEGTIGALTVGVSAPGRTLPDDITEAAEGLAAVAGLELSNALLYQTAEQALVARDRVLEVVAHDLRNLSSASRMCAIALESDADADPAVRRELYATIRESSDAIHRLVGDLLDLAAIETGRLTVRPAPVDPAAIVHTVAGLFRQRAEESGIALTTEVAEALPVLSLDRDRLVQALANLVHNALKFTDPGGRIAIHATGTAEAVVIAVADTGIGVEPARLEELLRAEWRATAGPGGSGLGLPITRGIMVAHGGDLSASSHPGHGTTFVMTLPRQS